MMNEPNDCCKIQPSVLMPVHFIWLIERAQRGVRYFTKLWSGLYYFILFFCIYFFFVLRAQSEKCIAQGQSCHDLGARLTLSDIKSALCSNWCITMWHIMNITSQTHSCCQSGKEWSPSAPSEAWETLRESGAYWVHLYSKWFIQNTVSRKMHLGLR